MLVVEDNEINREYVIELLAELPCCIDIAGNGQEAIEQFEPGRYALILMDCQMPIVDGLKATRRIRALEISAAVLPVPIVAMTARAMSEDSKHCLESGMDAYISKPFRPGAFLELVSGFLARSAG